MTVDGVMTADPRYLCGGGASCYYLVAQRTVYVEGFLKCCVPFLTLHL